MKSVENRTAQLFYRQQGSGAPVIVLHGSASTGAQWTGLMAQLESRYRVIVPDLPGYGASREVPGTSRSRLRAEARAVAEIAIATGQPVHLVGHSYGGAVALKLALVWPELVCSLTLVEPAVFHLLRDGNAADAALFADIRGVAGCMSASAASDAPDAAMAHFVDFWNGKSAWAGFRPEQRTRMKEALGAVLGNFAAGFAEDFAIADCANITCPVQLVMGLQSQPAAQRVTEMLAETLPDARLTLISDAGHMSPVTHPHVVNPTIAKHIATADHVHRTGEPTRTRWVA